MTNRCWTSKDDENLKPTYYYDEGHYPHSIQDKPVIDSPSLPSKPSVDYDRIWRAGNARNGYTVQCDFIMGLWRDGIDYMKTVGYACHWLAEFNQLNNIPERIYSLRELQMMKYPFEEE